ncbi:hypothetical protein [uncultured Acinetobacter sp.]|uniref:hypothetical protein n=1 Tax=uncultured Acinetobacter sp. TaxID=165433 RepID=UPI00258F3D3C|nr:hypothetical protein [uncultured Acinetobacter sp.]
MSDEYRDDTQETAFITDYSWIRLKVTTSEVAKSVTTILFSLCVLQTDYALASDELLDSKLIFSEEIIYSNDLLLSSNKSQKLINDKVKSTDKDLSKNKTTELVYDAVSVNEEYNNRLINCITEIANVYDQLITNKKSNILIDDRVTISSKDLSKASKKNLIIDNCTIIDSEFGQLKNLVFDHIQCSESLNLHRISNISLKENFRVQDKLIIVFREISNHLVFITDNYKNKLNVTLCVEDQCLVTEFFQIPIEFISSIEDKLTASEFISSKLTANSFITDHIYVDDNSFTHFSDGFAWTANTDTWAMSRYDNYQFHDMVVIDGGLYGINDSGVFRVDVDSDVDAKVVTGQLDIGQGQLVHPVAAYLEYQLSGNSKKLEVGVSTTQGGTKQTYYYPLPNEQSDYLTNGRVLFGRGLRGRHFSFEFKISGQSGYINDLRIDVTPTKRRV